MRQKGFQQGQKPEITAEAIKLQRDSVVKKYIGEVNKLKAEIVELEVQKAGIQKELHFRFQSENESVQKDKLEAKDILAKAEVKLSEAEQSSKTLGESEEKSRENYLAQKEHLARLKATNDKANSDLQKDRQGLLKQEDSLQDRSDQLSHKELLLQKEQKKLQKEVEDFEHTRHSIDGKLDEYKKVKDEANKIFAETESARAVVLAEQGTLRDALAVLNKEKKKIKEEVAVLTSKKMENQKVLDGNKMVLKGIKLQETKIRELESQLKTKEAALNFKERKILQRERYVKQAEKGKKETS